MLIDAFIDFTRMPANFDLAGALARLSNPDLLGSIARRVTCGLPSNTAVAAVPAPARWQLRARPPVETCRDAMNAAAGMDGPFLILLGDVQPSAEAIGVLAEALDADPMVGFAAARLTGSSENSLARLAIAGDAAIDELPRRLLAEMPETYFAADVPARCLLIKPGLLAEFGELDGRFRTLPGALWHYMTQARRCGFRTLVCNRAIAAAGAEARPFAACTATARALQDTDRALLRELSPDVERSAREFGTAAAAAAETRLARALYRSYGTRPSLLLDARNVGASINGTTIAALGISRGLYSLHCGWDITILTSAEASTFHGLEEAFPRWQVITKLPSRQYTAALRLSQPWNTQEMVDLHTLAAFNAYLLLDTISWDVVYSAPRCLDGTWRFMATHADALLFISAFTRDRFRRRFPSARDLPDLVSHLSFNPADYIHPDVRPPYGGERFIFIVGNEYDHKDVGPTLDLLSTAFPYESFVALGPPREATPRIKVLRSGSLSDAQVHRLYADAGLVLFPSFYEGFGFPVVTTLAYGRTVVARHSGLLEEIAAHCLPHGRIVSFTRRDELVDIVGHLLHGEELTSLPLGAAIENGRPLTWHDVGERILAFLETLTGDLSRSRWRAREHTISQLMAAPASLVDKGLKQPAVDGEGTSPV